MVGDSNIHQIVYSDISLSLFEDSGWYSVDYSYADTILWGYHKGCSFLVDACIIDGNYQSEEFCNVSSSISLCDITHTYKGACNLGYSTVPIPSQYQYFSEPYIGGNDLLADYCPYVLPTNDGSCQDISQVATSIDTINYGESACTNCRCLEGTYVSQFSTLNTHYHAGCHEVTCEGDVAVVHVGIQIVFCDPAGGISTIPGYDGYIICPVSNILCRNLPCPFGCYGKGKCINGICSCNKGYSGTYCESFARIILITNIFLLII